MLRALLAGLAGAVTLNSIHEIARRVRPEDAPRMDVLGMRALTRAFRAADANPPPAPELHTLTLTGARRRAASSATCFFQAPWVANGLPRVQAAPTW